MLDFGGGACYTRFFVLTLWANTILDLSRSFKKYLPIIRSWGGGSIVTGARGSNLVCAGGALFDSTLTPSYGSEYLFVDVLNLYCDEFRRVREVREQVC